MEVGDILMGARALIRKGWCQHNNAEDQDGDGVEVSHKFAKKFCPHGALCRVAGSANPVTWYEGVLEAFSAFRHAIGDVDIATWNDRKDRTKAQVLEAFDKAIQEAERTKQ